MTGPFISILRFDLRAIARDHLLALIVVLITIVISVVFGVGLMRTELGAEPARHWIRYLVILSIISNSGSFGMVFAVLLIEEIETGVRSAIMTTPFPPAQFLLMRTPLLIVLLTMIGTATGWALSFAWDLSALSFPQWVVLALAGALVGPAVMLSLSTFASNRLEAMAMGKFYSWIVTAPILIYMLPTDAWYRHLFMVLPTTPLINAYEAFQNGASVNAYLWLLFGAIYATFLTGLAVHFFLRRQY